MSSLSLSPLSVANHVTSFLIQMIVLYKDPEGDTVFTSKADNNSSNVMALNPTETVQQQAAEITTLRQRVKDLEHRLSQFKVSLGEKGMSFISPPLLPSEQLSLSLFP